jgi:hypothetical protein
MNSPLNELREKMIHETEEFLDHNLQDGVPTPQLPRISVHPAMQPEHEPSDHRPYFIPSWHDWAPQPQANSA